MERSASYQIGQTIFEVRYGDITLLDTEVIVSSDDSKLSMGSGVSAAIAKKAGEGYLKEAEKYRKVHRQLDLGEVALTSAGELPSLYVIHGITIDKEEGKFASSDSIRQIVERSLTLCDHLNVRSIAFPALGTGLAKVSFTQAAQAMTTAVASYLLKQTGVNKVVLSLFPKKDTSLAEMDMFYEVAVGLAAIMAQAQQMGQQLAGAGAKLSSEGKNEQAMALNSLQQKITTAANAIQMANDDDGTEQLLGSINQDIEGFVAQQEASSAEAQNPDMLRTKLSGLLTNLNIKRVKLNKYQIEENRYKGKTVPPSLLNNIQAQQKEIEGLNQKISALRQQLLALA